MPDTSIQKYFDYEQLMTAQTVADVNVAYEHVAKQPPTVDTVVDVCLQYDLNDILKDLRTDYLVGVQSTSVFSLADLSDSNLQRLGDSNYIAGNTKTDSNTSTRSYYLYDRVLGLTDASGGPYWDTNKEDTNLIGVVLNYDELKNPQEPYDTNYDTNQDDTNFVKVYYIVIPKADAEKIDTNWQPTDGSIRINAFNENAWYKVFHDGDDSNGIMKTWATEKLVQHAGRYQVIQNNDIVDTKTRLFVHVMTDILGLLFRIDLQNQASSLDALTDFNPVRDDQSINPVGSAAIDTYQTQRWMQGEEVFEDSDRQALFAEFYKQTFNGTQLKEINIQMMVNHKYKHDSTAYGQPLLIANDGLKCLVRLIGVREEYDVNTQDTGTSVRLNNITLSITLKQT